MSEQEYKKQPLEQLWSKLSGADTCKSLLKKHLHKDGNDSRYNELKSKKTDLGGDLGDCIQSGCVNLDSGVGLYACDPQAYLTFSPLFDDVIKDYHKVDAVTHPTPSWLPKNKTEADILKELNSLEETGKGMIVSTRVRVGRSHEGVPFPPTLTNEQRLDIEKKTSEALKKLDGVHKGTYYPLTGMVKDVETKLIADHFLFKNDDRFLREAGGYKDWAQGRGIYHNDGKTFLVWLNEEDHLRFISMEMGGKLGDVYCRLKQAIEKLEKTGLKFAQDKDRGFLTFCPTNLGTAMRASVHIAIPNLQKNPDKLKETCDKYNLQPRGIHGEHTESEGGVFDISNKRRLGLTEYDAVNEMYKGLQAIIEAEKSFG